MFAITKSLTTQLFLILGILLASNSVFAQAVDTFPTERNAFVESFATFISASKTKEVLEVAEKFEEDAFRKFTQEELDTIIRFTTKMKQMRFRAKPSFTNYLQVLDIIKTNTDDPNAFVSWHQIANDIIQYDPKPKKNLDKYIKFSIPFYRDRAFKDSKLGGVVWQIIGGDYDLSYDQSKENEGVKIAVKEADLLALRRVDSLLIRQTSGEYSLSKNVWNGTGGRVSWEKSTLDASVYAEFSDYRIDMTKGLVHGDSAYLTYPFISDQKIIGRVTDKVQKTSARSQYPEFMSTRADIQFKNMGAGVNLIGGIELHGKNLKAIAKKRQKAIITYHKPENPRILFKGVGRSFTIKAEDKISGRQIESSIFFGQDSIYHPSVTFNYYIQKNELSLARSEKGSDLNPFFNSYYQVNIDVDKIKYLVQQEKILVGNKDLSVDRIKNEVAFESVSFYNEADYLRYQGVSKRNPIADLLRLSTETGDSTFSEVVIADRVNPNVTAEENKRLLYRLASEGFIFYDTDNKEVRLREKLFHYGRASTNNADYDPINIVSKSKDANAVFDIEKGHTDINDVTSMELSRKQSVGIKPHQDQVKMLKNRDMEFDGILYAGMAVFQGSSMHFNYHNFSVDLDSVRFVDYYLPTGRKKKNGKPIAKSIDSRIEYATGNLLIDAPQNKSGRKDIPMFPSFASKDYSYVFYDREDIRHGRYTRDSFYFKLDKYTFNSLDSYVKEDLEFDGTMVSANIFPDFTETIKVQEDLSFGFHTNTPATGYPAYAQKGTFTGEIDLSNKEGFVGKGLINYLTSSLNSEDIVFYPKQMTCTAHLFDMKEDRQSQVKVPKANGELVSVNWLPYQDSMYIKTKEKAFDLFEAPDYYMTGTMILTTAGAKASGVFDWTGGELSSKLMDLGPFSAHADTADLKIKAIGESGIALNTKNLNGTLDFDQQIGSFEANNDSVMTMLPQNQYKTNINKFDWDMTKELIRFHTNPDVIASFTSTHSEQDELSFEGKEAVYNLKTAELNISGVDVIQSCDAYIYPAKGKVDIEKAAKMTTLQEAKIVADTSNKYHVFNRATVDVQGKKLYKASGYYEYNIPRQNQEILFDNIIGQRVGKGKHSEKATLTTAHTNVNVDKQFFIDEKTQFKGDIHLRANESNLTFDGFAKFDIPLLAERLNWFSIHSKGDRENLIIDLRSPKNPEGMPLEVGVFLSKETAKMYPRILQPLNIRKDRPILDGMGQIKYNKEKGQFLFGDSLRVNNYGDAGNLVVINANDLSVEGDGLLNIGSGLDYLNIDAAGIVETKFALDTTETVLTAQMMAGIEFPFPEALLRIISADIKTSGFDLADNNYNNAPAFYTQAVSQLISDRKDLINTKKTIQQNGLLLPKSFDKYKLFFAKLDMQWLPEYQSFMTTKSKNELGAFAGQPINKKIRSYVEFKMPSNEDDRVYIYLKLPNDNFYFFGYQGGILSTASNNDQFTAAADKLKEKELTFKMGKGKENVVVVELVNPLSAQLFVKRVKTATGK